MATKKAGKNELEFINQRSRQQMVAWCEESVSAHGPVHIDTKGYLQPYFEFALSKGWLSVQGQTSPSDKSILTCRVLSTGWATAARFLKR